MLIEKKKLFTSVFVCLHLNECNGMQNAQLSKINIFNEWIEIESGENDREKRKNGLKVWRRDEKSHPNIEVYGTIEKCIK